MHGYTEENGQDQSVDSNHYFFKQNSRQLENFAHHTAFCVSASVPPTHLAPFTVRPKVMVKNPNPVLRSQAWLLFGW